MVKDVVRSYITGGVQSFRVDQPFLTVKTFRRISARYIGSLVRVSCCDCTVPNFLEVPSAEPVPSECAHYSTAILLASNKIKFLDS